MRNDNHLLRDTGGSSIVEFTLVFPVLFLVALGTVDFSLMLSDWTSANKATYLGARAAIVIDPLASGITNLSYDPTLLSQPCFDPATGTANPNCPTASSICTPAATNGSCTNGYGWNETSFTNVNQTGILDQMRRVFPRVQRQNVLIAYQTTGLGFAGRPNGLPMNVTVSISCMTNTFYFIGGLMGWAFSPPAGCPVGTPAGMSLRTFSTTLPSEDMVTD